MRYDFSALQHLPVIHLMGVGLFCWHGHGHGHGHGYIKGSWARLIDDVMTTLTWIPFICS